MTRQLEQVREDRQKKSDMAVLLAIDGGLTADVGRSGAVLSGFSVRLDGGDCLLTLRAELAGRRQISFVGAETLTAALIKVCREARRDRLVWRADKYGGK